RFHRSPDGLDGLLRDFFHAELPNPWPRAPGAAPPPRRALPSPWLRFRRRFALAAAVGFFLVGALLLTRGFPEVKQPAVSGPDPPISPFGDTANKGKRPHNIDPVKTLEQQPDFKPQKLEPLDLPPHKGSGRPKVLPLETRPDRSRTFGLQQPDRTLIVVGVWEKNSPGALAGPARGNLR